MLIISGFSVRSHNNNCKNFLQAVRLITCNKICRGVFKPIAAYNNNTGIPIEKCVHDFGKKLNTSKADEVKNNYCLQVFRI